MYTKSASLATWIWVAFLPGLSFTLFLPCPNNPTKRYASLEGTIHYNVESSSSAPKANATVLFQKLETSFSEEICNVTVRPPIEFGGEIRISFLLSILSVDLPANALFNTSSMRSVLNDTSSIREIFSISDANGISLKALTAGINECYSSLHTCSPNAECIDYHIGFDCICNVGYAGDGYNCTEVTCSLDTAPKPLSFVNITVTDSEGKILDATTGMVPYGTTLVFTCGKYYTPTEYGTDKFAEISSSVCGGTPEYKNTGWSGTDVQCSISFEFRIAIACAVVSSLIIIMISACFIASWCSSSSKQKQEDRMVLPLDEVMPQDYYQR